VERKKNEKTLKPSRLRGATKGLREAPQKLVKIEWGGECEKGEKGLSTHRTGPSVNEG